MRSHNDVRELQQHVARQQAAKLLLPMLAGPKDLSFVPQQPLLREDVEARGLELRSFSARISAAASTTLPREVLINTAPGFMRVNCASEIKWFVEAVAGTCKVMASASSSTVLRSA